MADEKEPSKEGQEEEPKKKSRLMLFIIIGVVALGGGGGTVFFLMGGDPPPVETAENTPVTPPVSDKRVIMTLDPFVFNLAGTDSDRFAKVGIRLLLPDQSAVDKISGDRILMSRLRDRLLTLLASKTFNEVNNAVGKETLRREIATRVEQALDGMPVGDVFFSDFVVQ